MKVNGEGLSGQNISHTILLSVGQIRPETSLRSLRKNDLGTLLPWGKIAFPTMIELLKHMNTQKKKKKGAIKQEKIYINKKKSEKQ